MKLAALLLCLVLIYHANAVYFQLPNHYNDLEKLLLDRINFSANPCDDFYNYACGSSKEGYSSAIQKENDRILISGLEELRSSDIHENLLSSEAINKALQYYTACVDEGVSEYDVAEHNRNIVNLKLLPMMNILNGSFFFNTNAEVNLDRRNFSVILQLAHDEFHDEPFFTSAAMSNTFNKLPDTLAYFVVTDAKPTFGNKKIYDCDTKNKLLDAFIGGVRIVMDTLELKASKREVKKVAKELMELELKLLGYCEEKIYKVRVIFPDETDSSGENDSSKELDSLEKTDFISRNVANIAELTFENVNINFDLDNYIKKIITYGAGDNLVDFENMQVLNFKRYFPEILTKTSNATLLRYIIFRGIVKNSQTPDCGAILSNLLLIRSRIYTESKYSSVMEREALRSFVTNIIKNIKMTLKEMVTSMPWIQNDKKAYKILVKKFNRMTAHVAIESDMLNNTWIDKYYSQIEFNDDDSFLDMHSKVLKFQSYAKVRSLIYPQTNVEQDSSVMNAGYSPKLNKFVIFDGYLVAPMYHSKYPLSYNFGSIGFVIGHEIGHSVCTIGIQFDENRIENHFLGDDASKEYYAMAECLINQYNKIKVLPSNYVPNTVNGYKTLGENMADISGLEAAYRTFKAFEKKYGQDRRLRHPKLSKLTQDQLFFLGSVGLFCGPIDDKRKHYLLKNDEHAPKQARVEALRNLPAFGKAFNCPVGSKYRPEKYCKIWTP